MLSMSFHPRWLSIRNTKQQKLNKNCADQSQLSKPRHVYTWVNSGCRCPKIGNALALRTRGGQFEGPGPIISLCGKSMGFIRPWGGGLMLGMSVDKHCTRTNSVTRFDTQLRTTDSTGATTRTARSPHICVLPQSKCTSRTAGVEFVVKTMELHSGSKFCHLSSQDFPVYSLR